MTTVDVIDSPTLSPTHDQAAAYAALTEDAIKARKAMDTGRWILGECTRMLMDAAVYGQHSIEDFADDIGIDPKRLYEFAGMATYYTPETRISLSGLNLTYSHMREAKRLKDVNKSIAFLKEVALNVWTIRQTQDALKALFSPDALPSYSDTPITDPNNQRIDQRPNYQWRGRATVSIDAKGVVRLQCEGIPEIESGEVYMVSFEAYRSE